MNRFSWSALAAATLCLLPGCSNRCCPPRAGAAPARPATTSLPRGPESSATPASPATDGPAPAPGAGTTPPPASTAAAFPHTDFLGDQYAKLKPWKSPGTWYWLKEGIDLRGHDNVLIDPIAWKPLEGSAAASIPEAGQASLRKCLMDRLVARLEPYYPLVDDPEPHTLRVRFAITEADLRAASQDETAQGGATIEGDIRDAESGEVYGAFVSTIRGSTRGADREVDDCWGPVDGAFREWADHLLDWLDHHTK